MQIEDRIPLLDASGCNLRPPRFFTAAQANDLYQAKLIRKCDRRGRVTGVKLLPGTSIAAINAHLRAKIDHRLPTAEDNVTCVKIDKVFAFIHTAAWSTALRWDQQP